MKKLLVVLVLLIAGCVFAQQTQDLGALAKKEKARREALAKEGKKAKVYTKDDIERVKDKLGIEHTGSGSDQDATSADTGGATGQDTATEAIPLDNQAAKEEQRRQFQDQLDDLQAKKDELRKKIDDNKARTANGVLSVDPVQTLQEMNEFESQMKDLDRQIQDLQQQLQDLESPNRE